MGCIKFKFREKAVVLMLDAFIAMFLCEEDRHYRGRGCSLLQTESAWLVWTWVHRFYSNWQLILYELMRVSRAVLFQLVLELHILCAQYWTLSPIPPATTSKRWFLSFQLTSCDTPTTLSDIENTIASHPVGILWKVVVILQFWDVVLLWLKHDIALL